jgi:hypothetical protein
LVAGAITIRRHGIPTCCADQWVAGPTTRTMPVNGTYGGQGKAVGSSDLPAALLSELPKQQKRHFVLPVTGGGAGIAYFVLSAGSSPQRVREKAPTLSPLGLFLLRDPHLKRKKPRRVKRCARAPICNGPYSIPIGRAETTQKPVSVGLTARRRSRFRNSVQSLQCQCVERNARM